MIENIITSFFLGMMLVITIWIINIRRAARRKSENNETSPSEDPSSSFDKNLISYESITTKKMFYNTKETEAIQKLISILQEENYREIQNRLDSKGMRKGFACLFSGTPGTGKTETAYQIARETKRNILRVDIPKIRGMFFGEDAKKIKEVFEIYKKAMEESTLAPILLFNEADALIGKRIELGSTSRAADMDENATQNVILQEMENFSGILIATTNLPQNMDKAYERRFLYKINFEKPSKESRRNIWNTLLPDLPVELTGELAASYDFSGGQIENIARKSEVEFIISGGILLSNTVIQYCKDENENGFNTTRRIGF